MKKLKKYIDCYNKKRRERRKNFFKDKICEFCSGTDHLELDHRVPSKKIDHKIWTWSEKNLLKEIKKCRILCRHCHRLRHLSSRRSKHGTCGRYTRYSCRCKKCCAAKAQDNRKYRLKKRSQENSTLSAPVQKQETNKGTTPHGKGNSKMV
jgi:hypothetical protein